MENLKWLKAVKVEHEESQGIKKHIPNMAIYIYFF